MAQGGRSVIGRPSLYSVLVGAFLAAALAIGFVDPFYLKAIRLIGFDSYQRLAPHPATTDAPVRVVDIDEESLSKIGQWPWPREKIAALTDALGRGGAAVVAFDMMFPEPDRTSPDVIAKSLPPEVSAALDPVLAKLVSNDDVLAGVLARTPAVLGVTLTQEDLPAAPFPQKWGIVVAGDNPVPFLHGYSSYTGNLPAFNTAARGVGAINWIPDRDQVVRRVPLFFRRGDVIVPSLAAEALRVAQGASTYVIKASNASGETAFGQASGINHVKIGAFEIPTDGDGAMWLRFSRIDRSRLIPAWRVLSGDVPADAVAGAIVLIGTSAAGLVDLRATPVDEAVPGVFVHEQILQHILSGRYLTRPDWARAFELVVTAVAGIGLAIVFPTVGVWVAAALALGAIALINFAAWTAFNQLGLLFDPLYPSICLFGLGAGAAVLLYRRTEVQRQEIRRAFNHYVSPNVVRELIAHPEKLVLGGEIRKLTIMFCDVRKFSRIAEALSAEELTSFINEMFTPLSDVILRTGGTIDKYMGDAVVAFWNAPLDDDRHCDHALEAGAGILQTLDRLNVRWQERAKASGRNFPIVAVGVGINTGECCVGNLGSIQRFDYSAIGDEVNIASRFEGLTKLYGVALLTGDATLDEASAQPALELDLVQVVGRTQPSRIFTLIETLRIPRARFEALLPVHSRMLAAYRAGDWAAAEAAIEACRALEITPLAAYYDLFKARIAVYKLAPPPEDWNGVYEAQEK